MRERRGDQKNEEVKKEIFRQSGGKKMRKERKGSID